MDTVNTTNSDEIDFMSMVSHELSTPLGSVRWNAELLRSGRMTTPLDPGQAQLADEIITGVKRMGDLVNDIHEASWLERNKFGDDPSLLVAGELIAQVQAEQETAAKAKDLTITTRVDPMLPTLMARKSTVLLLMQNLLSNAIKYTSDNGTVTVTARSATAEETAKCPVVAGAAIYISVVDTGIGIPASQHDRVFHKFFRADNARSLGVDGTGLGTYIIALAVKSLRGAVWFESTDGRGTVFYVVLPVSNPAETK